MPTSGAGSRQSRHGNIGVLVGTVRFLAIAVFQTGRGLSYLLRPAATETELARSEGTRRVGERGMKRCLILAFAVIVGSQTGNAQPVPAPFAMERSAANAAGAQPSTAGAGSRPFEMKPAGAGSLAPGLGIRTPPERAHARGDRGAGTGRSRRGAGRASAPPGRRSGTTEAGSSEAPGRLHPAGRKLHLEGETDPAAGRSS